VTKTPEKAPPKGASVDKPKAGRKPNALQQPLQPSEDLAAVVGGGTMARGEVVSKVWLSRTLRGSCRQQNAAAEQVEAGVTIHLALDGF